MGASRRRFTEQKRKNFTASRAVEILHTARWVPGRITDGQVRTENTTGHRQEYRDVLYTDDTTRTIQHGEQLCPNTFGCRSGQTRHPAAHLSDATTSSSRSTSASRVRPPHQTGAPPCFPRNAATGHRRAAQPFLGKPHARLAGYETYRRTPRGTWLSGRNARRYKGTRVWLNPHHGPTLLRLAEVTGLQLVWATTWMHEANTLIGPVIGLPELPVIEFAPSDLEPDGSCGHHWLPSGNWKWHSVARYAAGRPIAWLDDDHNDPRFATARADFELGRSTTPTLLCHVDARTGFTPPR